MTPRRSSRVEADENHATVDLVVVGGGGGLVAAVAAAEKGAKVLLLERRMKVGGNISLARGFMAAESPVQQRLKIVARKEDLFNTTMSYGHWKIDPFIVKALVDKSGDTVGWFEKMGVMFADVPHCYYNQSPRIYHIPEGHGSALTKVLVERCHALGVRILTGTRATKVLVDDEGRVTGVEARTKNSPVRIASKAVIIATGGYSGNKGMLKEHYSHYTESIRLYGLPNLGDGYSMVREIGAATEGLGTVLLMGPLFEGSLYVHSVAVEPNVVWVNSRGERFVNEAYDVSSETANALNRQPGKISYALFDESIKQGFIERGLIRGADSHYPVATKMTDLDKHLRKEVQNGRAVISRSWEEIALWMGADCDRLKDTIDQYNGYCANHLDELCYKERRFLEPLLTPPFYALRCCQAFHGTVGGIKINHRMEVLDEVDSPIPGLFAMGNDTGGWVSDTYCYVLTGTALAFALNSGRISGENAASYAMNGAPIR
jgi:fumarate reductase flavoprotein subunit